MKNFSRAAGEVKRATERYRIEKFSPELLYRIDCARHAHVPTLEIASTKIKLVLSLQPEQTKIIFCAGAGEVKRTECSASIKPSPS